jgi:hypothetical protein
MDYVNIDDSRVKKAIAFVEEQIDLCLKHNPSSFLDFQFEKLSWIYYSPANTPDEKRERNLLIQKYGAPRPNQIQHYLLYHNCDDFAVFYWTVLRANGITTQIIRQEKPFPHTYLQRDSGEILDALLFYCGVSYPYQLENARKFKNPHDFYAGVFISKTDLRDWEIGVLEQLRTLE